MKGSIFPRQHGVISEFHRARLEYQLYFLGTLFNVARIVFAKWAKVKGF
jgi:hypothetical protein